MQSAASRSSGQCSTSGSSLRTQALVASVRRPSTRPRGAPQVVNSALAADWSTVSHVATLIAGAGILALLSSERVAVEQDRTRSESEPCPRCNGRGVEECMCTRWSDGDAGCSACGRSGFMKCRSCGGGGTAVPLLSTIKQRSNGGRHMQ